MSETFSLDDYDPDYDDVEEYHERDDTPFDHKMSPEDSAIERRQKSKGEKGHGATGTAPKSDSNRHMTKLEDPDKRKSVSERVTNRRHGKAHTRVEEPTPGDDPANW